jgi:hypothetical protein
MIAGEAGGGGVPCLPRRTPRTPHLHRVPGRATGGARARPGRTRGKPSSPAGWERREHPRAGPKAPSPTCHFQASRCRGCGHRRLREPRCVRARACECLCVCVCVCVCVRACESLFAARLLSRSRAATPSPPPRPPSPSGAAPPSAASAPHRPAPPRCAHLGRPLPRAPPARRSRRAGPRAAPGPPPLLPAATLPLEPKPSPRSPNLPGYGACPVRRPAGLGVDRGRAGRPGWGLAVPGSPPPPSRCRVWARARGDWAEPAAGHHAPLATDSAGARPGRRGCEPARTGSGERELRFRLCYIEQTRRACTLQQALWDRDFIHSARKTICRRKYYNGLTLSQKVISKVFPQVILRRAPHSTPPPRLRFQGCWGSLWPALLVLWTDTRVPEVLLRRPGHVHPASPFVETLHWSRSGTPRGLPPTEATRLPPSPAWRRPPKPGDVAPAHWGLGPMLAAELGMLSCLNWAGGSRGKGSV